MRKDGLVNVDLLNQADISLSGLPWWYVPNKEEMQAILKLEQKIHEYKLYLGERMQP